MHLVRAVDRHSSPARPQHVDGFADDRWLDVYSGFDFEMGYIPRETNGFADALSRVYGDESELVNDKDEMKTYWPPKVSTVYMEVHLLLLMNAEVKRSAGLTRKSTAWYKKRKGCKPKETRDEPGGTPVSGN